MQAMWLVLWVVVAAMKGALLEISLGRSWAHMGVLFAWNVFAYEVNKRHMRRVVRVHIG